MSLGIGGIVLRLTGTHVTPLVDLLLYGGAVLGAAFLLAWAAEALQHDVSQGLAMAVLAFIAVLPEYAVDLYFAWSAARYPEYAQYAAANMTGSNRLLIGVGWSAVVLVGTFAFRRSMRGQRVPVGSPANLARDAVWIHKGSSVDLVVLMLATVWAMGMPLFRQIALWNGAGLLLLFGFYLWRISGRAEEEPELVGVAHALGQLPKALRRVAVGGLLALSACVLLASAEPFAESLIGTGEVLGIDKFLLVQWLAPLASEAPELLVAIIFAARCHASAGLAALLSSKVNQWTLLVGTLPIVYSLAMGRPAALHLDARQTEELVLTAAQGLLGVAFLANGMLHRWEAMALLVLFLVQLPFPDTRVRYGISALYLILSAVLLVRDRAYLAAHLRRALGQSTDEEGAAEAPGA